MKTAIFAIALMASGAAIAQTTQDDMTTTTTTAPASDWGVANTVPSTGQVQAPSNANPEHDARGIAVISDPAIVPAGYNGTSASGVGGPAIDPATGAAMTMTDTAHPACTRQITDNCVQTYERGRSPR